MNDVASTTPTSDRGLYRLRDTNRSVRLAALLFMLLLGYAYVFAFLMVREFSGLSPGDVRDTYVPARVDEASLAQESHGVTQELDLEGLEGEKHRVDTMLLVQDSHIHILMFALVAALQSLIVLGLGWPGGFRDAVIFAAFASGGLDFSGQWLMKAGLGGFAWLTLAAGWLMVAVYVVVLGGTLRAVFPLLRSTQRREG